MIFTGVALGAVKTALVAERSRVALLGRASGLMVGTTELVDGDDVAVVVAEVSRGVAEAVLGSVDELVDELEPVASAPLSGVVWAKAPSGMYVPNTNKKAATAANRRRM